MVLDLYSEKLSVMLCDVPSEPWQQRQANDHQEFLFLLNSPDDSLGKGIRYLIVDFISGSGGDEELVLYVDEFLAVFNQMNVGLLYGYLLVVLRKPNGPITPRSQPLDHEVAILHPH